ncbi:DUF2309 domain-containing protein [Tundrisphaera lichenicola]|uniref:DUF2309 domain-containing protein n=1 Tax=Tundrisphaera lichenicola TaxID=2029860 RepID=UPI003EB75499
MHASSASEAFSTVAEGHQDRRSRLYKIIEHASHFLPAQGPITVFIHHNTLHAFEDLHFDEAVQKGARFYGCQPYMTEDRYRAALQRGRIGFSDLQEVLELDLGEQAEKRFGSLGSKLDLRLAMLQYPLQTGPTEELVWYVAETDALRKIRKEVSSAVRSRMIAETRRWVVRDLRGGGDPLRLGSKLIADGQVSESLAELFRRFDGSAIEEWNDERWESFTLQALWRIACDGVREVPAEGPKPGPSMRHRDLLLALTGFDADTQVHDFLIRFCGAYLDQGLAPWTLPAREEGFLRSFCSLYQGASDPPDRWLRGLGLELARIVEQGIQPLDSILESLEILGVPEEEYESFLSETLLALRGWAGMIRQVERHGDRAVHPIREGSLVDFLAVRLILDRYSLTESARGALGYCRPLDELRDEIRGRLTIPPSASVEQRAFLIFQLAQLFGLSPDRLIEFDSAGWTNLVNELESFSGIERRRVFHLAYEKRFTTHTLDAISLRSRKRVGRPVSPKFQVICCIDEREESFRRHLEEIAPEVETFGVAGFFGVAMYYKGVADAHFVPLCPAILSPKHWMIEELVQEPTKIEQIKAGCRKVLGHASHRLHVGSRGFAFGALLTGAVGSLAAIPLMARILFPRLASQIRHYFGRIIKASPQTRLRLERTRPEPGPQGAGLGYSVDEMTDIAERILQDMGLTKGFARLVVVIGHGSHSQNNPHISAYNCGACGGAPGQPNARVLAQFLSDKRVRQKLGERGLGIPTDTIFVAGYHDTCNDSIIFDDLDHIPPSHFEEFQKARKALIEAGQRNAHERCRRFRSAPLSLTFEEAREHVEARSQDLSETRPELGHATNAITIVGRREWTRGLYLDRRAFLASYDPSTDDAENSILDRVLSAVFPVCGGINLEYYFSNVDNAGYGCGSKLAHNVASLLGVMDGAASDLRTGLSWQMVEIHEPLRSLFIIETTTEAMLRIMDRNEGIGRLCRNRWIQLAVLHPIERTISVFVEGEFRPYELQSFTIPKARTSADWYRGYRDHLEFAEIGL